MGLFTRKQKEPKIVPVSNEIYKNAIKREEEIEEAWKKYRAAKEKEEQMLREVDRIVGSTGYVGFGGIRRNIRKKTKKAKRRQRRQ